MRNVVNLKKGTFIVLCFFFAGSVVWAQDPNHIKIATWNIEHLGSPGRGLGGIGAGSLPPRTSNQLKAIARLIENDLHADLVAIQEVAISQITESEVESEALETIVDELGDEWEYRIGRSWTEDDDDLGEVHNIHNAFLWNSDRVRLVKVFEIEFPNAKAGQKRLFDRRPLIGYFQALKNGQDTNDFLLVNVHLASGQNNDENHLAAMVIIEQNLSSLLRYREVKESDRIVLGDFNDNPFAEKDDGSPKYSDFLYKYMEWKKYKDLVNKNTGATRMDSNRSSIIDHVLVNNSAKYHLAEEKVEKYQPADTTDSGLATWRRTYSDHFPLTFKVKVANSDDDVDWTD